jgi:hypothetical protein
MALGLAVGLGALPLRARADEPLRATSDATPVETGTVESGTVESGTDGLARAEEAYARLELEEASALLAAWLEALERPGATRPALEARIRALVLAASIARARGDLRGLDDALDGALALDPELRLDPALHPPPLLDALERRRAARALALVPPEVVEPTGREVTPPGPDPWPWVGLGLGALVVVGGTITLGVLLSAEPREFGIRGTILP